MLLLDSNLLLLYAVGTVKREQIGRFKRLEPFAPEDLDTLIGFLQRYGGRILSTPNVLTETSNWLGYLREPLRSLAFDRFGKEIDTIREEYVPSVDCARDPVFRRFGLTDLSITKAARDGVVVGTMDARLHAHLQKIGVESFNFTHHLSAPRT